MLLGSLASLWKSVEHNVVMYFFGKNTELDNHMALGLSPQTVALTSCLASGRSLKLSVLRFIHTQNSHAETQCLI